MKKQKILTLVFGIILSISLFFPQTSLADCRNKRFIFGCDSGYNDCGGGTCCLYPNECSQYVEPDTNSSSSSDNQSASSSNSSSNSQGDPAASDPTCPGGTAINTAIGCINVLGDQEVFLGILLAWAVGIGGGIAFLLIVYAGFMIMTSSGNPERLKAGQELMTSAISGIVLLVFSIFILNVIGVKILQIPGFGK